MKKINTGFTLIELLVVIAIIGLLASIVLASLRTARDKAADSAIKSNMNTIRTQAAILFNTYNAYGTQPDDMTTVREIGNVVGDPCKTGGHFFGDDPTVEAAISQILVKNGGNDNGACYISAPPQASFVLAVKLKTRAAGEGDHDWWCIDSSNNSIAVPYDIISWDLPLDGSAANCRDYSH